MTQHNLLVELLKTKTIKQSAEEIGVDYNYLRNYCLNNKLKSSVKRGRKCSPCEHEKEIVERYLGGMSESKIAQKFGVSRSLAARIIKAAGVAIRTQAEAARKREEDKGSEARKRQAAAANAVRHAMSIINRFGW